MSSLFNFFDSHCIFLETLYFFSHKDKSYLSIFLKWSMAYIIMTYYMTVYIPLYGFEKINWDEKYCDIIVIYMFSCSVINIVLFSFILNKWMYKISIFFMNFVILKQIITFMILLCCYNCKLETNSNYSNHTAQAFDYLKR